jgi:hypothetical protein
MHDRIVGDEVLLETSLERTSALTVVFFISGALAAPGTSSAQEKRIWERPFVHESEPTTSSPWGPAEIVGEDEVASEATRRAVNELRRRSGLTWDQLAAVFGVSRRSVHFWASGKPLSASNEELLMRFLDLVRNADQGDARRTRTALLESVAGRSAYDLVLRGRLDEARDLVGRGAPIVRPTLRELSPAAKHARKPSPPQELVEADGQRVHRDVGRGRAALTARNKRRGTP